ncbi:NlpC/P60 family protein [Hydrogenispora ethanolica]|jgi:cell wall-associated NlpC family hydrolase|uniref:NlpC/P60 family protein n=1 Tax=Hydrogenispora ethanolica TaxID=1082276 RepID=A0A4R1RW62_HYDET|nr:NlpC/P60 family protein [Hydrogenispora ethanolica]TCL70911.1 NlpC/P60 family protein [Hydrogenispora ethanolica]
MDPKIAEITRKYIGIPYRNAGRDLTGLDCLGLAYLFYQDFGIKIPDGDGREYSSKWVYEDPERYLRGIQKVGREVSFHEIQPLDFVYFRIGHYISHGGIMVDEHQFIHVLQNTRVHLTPMNWIWRRRLVGVRRFA